MKRVPCPSDCTCFVCLAERNAVDVVPMNEPHVGIGPSRPAIIAHRYGCPSCGALPAEACRLGGKFPQEYSHEARHRIARTADWAALRRDPSISISVGWELAR